MMTSSKAWFEAVQKGDIKMVRFLLQNNVRSYDELGETALMRSVRFFDRQLVQLLLEHEAGVISRDGSTALSIAATMGNAAACEMLYAREAKLGLQNRRTPLILASQAGHLKCVKILKDNSPAHRDAFNRSALDYAIQSGHSSIVNYLVSLPPVKEHCLNQAIMIARQMHNNQLAERLIDLRDKFSKSRIEPSHSAHQNNSRSSKYYAEAARPNVISEHAPELMGASSSSASTPNVDLTGSFCNMRSSNVRTSCLAGLLPRSTISSMGIPAPNQQIQAYQSNQSLPYFSTGTITKYNATDRDDRDRQKQQRETKSSDAVKENVIEVLFRRLHHNTEEIECLRRQIQVLRTQSISRSTTPADRRAASRQRDLPAAHNGNNNNSRYPYSQYGNDTSNEYRESYPYPRGSLQETDDYNGNLSNFGDSDGFNAGVLKEMGFPNTVVHNRNYMLSPANPGNGEHVYGDNQLIDTQFNYLQQEVENPDLPQVGDSTFSAFGDAYGASDAGLSYSTMQYVTDVNQPGVVDNGMGDYANDFDQEEEMPASMEQSYPVVSDSFRFATPQVKKNHDNVANSMGDAGDDMMQSYTEEEILQSNSGLMNAVLSGDMEAVITLIPTEAGLQNIIGKTALMYAIEEGFAAAANALLNYEMQYSDSVGITALMIAARVSNLDLIQRLLPEEAGMRSLGGRTALMLAARCNQPHSAAMLLDAEGTLVDEGGYTALHVAAVHNHADVASVLVAKEAGIKTIDGRTALMLAVEKDSMDATKVILPYECNATDNDDYTCLMQVAEVTDNPATAHILAPFEGGFVNKNGLTALEIAIRCHNYAVADVLVQKEGVSIMQYRVSTGQSQDYGEEPEQYTELMQACDQGDIVAVYCFKDQYFSSNVNGVTPLTIAEDRGYTDIVTLLRELFEGVPVVRTADHPHLTHDSFQMEGKSTCRENDEDDDSDYVPPPSDDFCEDNRRDTAAHSRRSVQHATQKSSLELYDSDIAGSENSYQSISFTSGTAQSRSSKNPSAHTSISTQSSRHNSASVISRGSVQSHNVVSIKTISDTASDPVPAPMPHRHSYHGMQHKLEPTLPDVEKQRHVMAETVTRQFATSLSSNRPSVPMNAGPSNHSSNAPSASTSFLAANISNLTVNSPASFIGQGETGEGTAIRILRPANAHAKMHSNQDTTMESAPNSVNAFASIEQHHLRVLNNGPGAADRSVQDKASSISVLTENSTMHSTLSTEGKKKSAPNINKNSELMLAIINGDCERAAELVGAQAGLVNRLKQTALMIACEKNNAGIASMLMEQEHGQVCPSYEMNCWKMAPATALMIAAMNGSIDCVQLIAKLEKKMKDNIGKTALMAGAYSGHLHIVRFLVAHEGRMQTRFGTTALMIATRENQVEIVRELMPCEHSIIDSNGFTALMIACERGFHECAAILAEKEVGVVVRQCPTTGEQWTGLAFAAATGNLKCITELACYEAREYGETALRALANSKTYVEEQRKELEKAIKRHMGSV